jgi:hypothetical protein
MNKLDDNAAAMADIANAPEVSGEGAIEPRKPLKLKMTGPELAAEDTAADERNARLLVTGVGSVMKSFTGKEMLQDQSEAVSEVASVLFSALRAAAIPRPVYLGLVGLIVAIPVIPPLFRFFTAKPKEEAMNG